MPSFCRGPEKRALKASLGPATTPFRRRPTCTHAVALACGDGRFSTEDSCGNCVTLLRFRRDLRFASDRKAGIVLRIVAKFLTGISPFDES
ncbi:hypothetical protein L596_007819 [Steinernema carpocapsae]|uniref:Uncharacterized protein n=1 Tax=Steinernema carpocapsae TaxID=34508 RepID=A0A4V6A643_STECR|nr:hypothetical protein L596_007819 [Steinernema carpocapsae]